MDRGLLPLVRRPARYLGNELNAVRTPAPGDLRVALAFPDLYEIGMSHLGLGILYDVLGNTGRVFPERVFLPDADMEALLAERDMPLTTLETGLPLSQLDILGFSLAYELTYTNVLAILAMGSIPIRSEERTRAHPLVIAGGPCAFNPEPLGAFIDAFVIGEAENLLPEICAVVREWKESGEQRESLLRALDGMQGVYVPSLFQWTPGTGEEPSRLISLHGRTDPVCKCPVPDLNRIQPPANPLVPFARVVHNRLSIEAARGCPHGCRFCQAGNLYRPYRERNPEAIVDAITAGLKKTGYGEVSLLALSMGDYSCLRPLVSTLMRRMEPRKISLSLPSLRVGSLAPEVVQDILRVRKTGFTMAPEAATERLRNVINKNIDQEELQRTTNLLSDLGWRSIKLYFMIGLPTETDADVEAIAELAKQIHRQTARGKGKHFQLTVNVSTFVPKPHTPFQWETQLDRKTAQEKQRFLQNRLRRPTFRLKWHDARQSLLEGLFARGDRKMGDLIEEAHRLGCRMDGWTDYLRFDLWQEAMERTGIDPDRYLRPPAAPGKPLPWDWVDTGADKQFFLRERTLAHEDTPSRFHCSGDCGGCGLCSAGRGMPRPGDTPSEQTALPAGRVGPPIIPGNRIPRAVPLMRMRLQYSKTEPSHYLSHLETVTLFYRTLRRSGLPIAFTEGENPHPKAAFSPALSVGTESLTEFIDAWFSSAVPPGEAMEKLNRVLPGGFSILSASAIPLAAPSLEKSILWTEYEFHFQEDHPLSPSEEALAQALETLEKSHPLPVGSPPEGSNGATKAPDLRSRFALQMHPRPEGFGFVCRVHRISENMPSPARIMENLFPEIASDKTVVTIRKLRSSLLSPAPSAVIPKRKPSRHAK